MRSEVLWKQLKQKLRCDQGARKGPLPQHGQKGFARNFRSGPSWLPGVVIQPSSSSSVQVELRDGTRWNRHGDHLREHRLPPVTPYREHGATDSSAERDRSTGSSGNEDPHEPTTVHPDRGPPRTREVSCQTLPTVQTPSSPQKLRSTRVKKPVDCYRP